MRRGKRDERAIESIDQALSRVAASQHGVFSRAQAIAAGADRNIIYRRTAASRWERAHPTVFRMAGSSRTWQQRMLAACLCWGGDVAASHGSALRLWGLPGAERMEHEITVPPDRQRNHPCEAIIHRSLLIQVDVAMIDAIPVTTPTRTLIDIAGSLPRDVVEEALDDALRRGLSSVARLRWRIDALSRRGRKGIGVIRSLVIARSREGSVPESVFETRLLRIFRAAGLDDVVQQHPVLDGSRPVAVFDFAFPNAHVAIEAEGYKWHSGRARWQRDLARRNVLTELGWKVVHVTWSDLNTEQLLRRVRRLLER
jgi:very-short-patch-repair endonuclease